MHSRGRRASTRALRDTNAGLIHRSGLVGVLLLATVMAAVTGGVSRAAVLRISSTVSTTVQEVMGGVPGSVTSDRKELGVDAMEPPMTASAELTSTDLDGKLVSAGKGISRFDDPTRLFQANPEELSLEVGCYSNAIDVSYRVDAATTESRTSIFARPGNPLARPEITFRSDGTREIESRVFLSGAMVVWSTHPLGFESDLKGELRIQVERSGDPAEPLFDASLRVTVSPGGELLTDVSGPLFFEELTLDELASLGVDSGTLEILSEVGQSGVFRVFAVPRQEHAYRYAVTADESFDLHATLSAQVRDAREGMGIAVVAGRPFEGLAEFIGLSLPGVDGNAVERAINEAAKRRDQTAGNGGAMPGGIRPLCGALGMEIFGLVALGYLPARSRFQRFRS